MNRVLPPSIFAAALAAAFVIAPFAALANNASANSTSANSTSANSTSANSTVPPDPTKDPMLITAGFLNHHPDMKYRMLGMEAYENKDYAEAMRFFRRAGFYGDKPSQGMVAEMYWNGQGVARDPVLAYVWMDLAAERGYRGFFGLRERYWTSLSEAERARAVEEGQAVYAKFGDAAAKPRYAFQLRAGRRQMTGSRTGFNHGVQIIVPGPEGGQAIEGSKFYDARYWDPKKYWAWQDNVWMKPKIGRVEIGEIQEYVPEGAAEQESRIPQTKPQVDAPVPEVDESAKPAPLRTPE
jgi:TPR repeat protein